MIKQAAQKIAELGLQNIELIAADAEHVNFKGERFDAVFYASAVIYLINVPTALKN